MNPTPLSPSRAEIRILTLSPTDDFSSDVHCTLENVSLLDHPRYVAVSYTSVDSKDYRPVWVNGEMIEVIANLESALRQLRAGGYVRLWVEALCINLNDSKEKSHQVVLMKSIYANAISVVAWLGAAADKSSRVMDALKDLADGASWNSIRESFEVDNFDFWAALDVLVQRPFWSRVWVLLEISVAYDICIQCGDRQISWTDLLKALDAIQWQPKTDSLYSIVASREAFQAAVSPSLLKALFDTHTFLVTDPLDRIYALISLAYDGPKLVPQLNYAQSIRYVYRELALGIILKTKCLDIISLRQHDGLELETLPSWVPNWNRLGSAYRPWQKEILFREKRPISVLSDTDKLPYYYFLPGEFYFLKAHPPSIDNWGNLRTSGWVLDTVCRLTTSMNDDGRRSSRVIISLEDQIIPSGARANPYRGKTNEAIAKCLCLGMAFPKGIPRAGDIKSARGIAILKEQYPHILRWLARNKYFGIAGQPFEKHLTKQTRTLKRMLATSAFLVSDLVAVSGKRRSEEPWFSLLDLDWDRPIYEGILERYFFHLDLVLREGMRLFVSDRGYLGMAHQQTRPGDKVCVISGCAMPVILRKCENGYRVVGEAYLHEFAFDTILKGQEFSLC